MKKEKVIKLFGGAMQTAKALGITHQAVYKWNSELSPRIADRVISACFRHGIDIPKELYQARKE